MPTDRQGDHQDARVAAQGEPLTEALKDAKVLLWFATREGRRVDDVVLSDLVSARSKLISEGHDPAVEATFWIAYRKLAAAVKPASVESILSTCKHPFGDYGQTEESRLANAQTTKRRYTISALWVLFVLLALQTYWFVITTFSADLQKHRDELDGMAGTLRIMSVQVGVVDALEGIKGPPEFDDAMPYQSLLQYQPTLAKMMMDLDSTHQLLTLANWELDNTIFRRQRVQSMLSSKMSVLQAWDFVGHFQLLVSSTVNLIQRRFDQDTEKITTPQLVIHLRMSVISELPSRLKANPEKFGQRESKKI